MKWLSLLYKRLNDPFVAKLIPSVTKYYIVAVMMVGTTREKDLP